MYVFRIALHKILIYLITIRSYTFLPLLSVQKLFCETAAINININYRSGNKLGSSR